MESNRGFELEPTILPDPAPAPAPRVAVGAPTQVPPLIWVLVALLLPLLIISLTPIFVQQITYSVVRGRETAQAEVARASLKDRSLNDISRGFGLIAKAIGPSVVHINATGQRDPPGGADEFAWFFEHPREFSSQDQGSGVIIDTAGYIVTNNHVVDGAKEIEVELSDGRAVMASKVGADPLTDLAVLKIDASDLIAAPWGDSDKLDVGSPVWAVGNPFGLDRSVTFGIISAKNRRLVDATGDRSLNNPYEDFLQTDAAVNPGNSGGPLVDIEGKVIGINTAIIGPSYQGISFSIPSNVAHEVYSRIREHGHVSRGWLGVQPGELTRDDGKRSGAPAMKGAVVLRVWQNSPASRAGLNRNDVVLEWNGAKVDSPTTLTLLVGKTAIGSDAKITVLRGENKLTLDVRVDERPQ